MGFQQFLTTRPWGAVYPRLVGFCIIIALGWGGSGVRCSLQMVQIWFGGREERGVLAETTFSHCRLHPPPLTTKVIRIAFVFL